MSDRARRICIVGPGTHFLGGVTYFTFTLANHLSDACDVSVILLRRLLPARLYPGWRRVGAPLSRLTLAPKISRFDGVDWFWGRSLPAALMYLARQRPGVLVLHWWTGTVLHTYLALALAARLLGAHLVIEFHEVLDPGEGGVPGAHIYVGLLGPLLHRLASGFIVHSSHDRGLVAERYRLDPARFEVVPHLPYDHFQTGSCLRAAPESCCNLLYFGLIRPYKGVEDLVRAFDAIPPAEIDGYWLTVVGETWESREEPARLIEASPYRHRITFINRYVADEEIDGIFGGADALVLPYRRASQSGTLHIGLRFGLPVVLTDVGGLAEAVDGYAGAILIEPGNPVALLQALRSVARLRGRRFASPHTSAAIVERYTNFFSRLV